MKDNTEPRTWRVCRFCCTSGMCIYCRAAANGTQRKWIMHCDNLTEAKAREMAANWSTYGARAEEMPAGPKTPEEILRQLRESAPVRRGI